MSKVNLNKSRLLLKRFTLVFIFLALSSVGLFLRLLVFNNQSNHHPVLPNQNQLTHYSALSIPNNASYLLPTVHSQGTYTSKELYYNGLATLFWKYECYNQSESGTFQAFIITDGHGTSTKRLARQTGLSGIGDKGFYIHNRFKLSVSTDKTCKWNASIIHN